MPRASQCSPVADWQQEPGRREVSRHGRHFGGVCAAPQVAPQLPGQCLEHTHGPASKGRSGGRPRQEPREPGEAGGARAGRTGPVGWSTAVTVCGSGLRNRHRLGSRPGRRPARGIQTRGAAEEQSGKGPVRTLAQLHLCTHCPTNPDGSAWAPCGMESPRPRAQQDPTNRPEVLDYPSLTQVGPSWDGILGSPVELSVHL